MLKVMNKVILREVEKGRSEGEKLGLERGSMNKATNIAQGMKKKGFKLEDIIELTGYHGKR